MPELEDLKPEEDNRDANGAISELLDREPEEELENSDSSETETEEENQIEEPIISEKLVKELGLPKGFAGQPISKLGKSYKDIQSQYSKVTNELAELNSKQKKEVEETAKEELGDMPDPYDDPDGFKGWMKGLRDIIKKEALEEARKELEPIRADKIAQETQKAYDQLTEAIGDDAEDILKEWVKEEGLTKDQAEFYRKNPLKLVKPVIRYYKALEYDNLLANREDGDKAAENVKKKVKSDPLKVNRAKVPESSGVLKEMLKNYSE